MTQGIVSIRVNGEMRFKVITGCDGYNAPRLAERIAELGHAPTLAEIVRLANECGFGDAESRVILEANPVRWNRPTIHSNARDWDDEGRKRYLDTFHVAEFNPRWKYGTADYVKVIEVSA